MLLLGLTGDIACGKSTVARWLVARGAVHLDADLLVRELYNDPEFAHDVTQYLLASETEDRVLDGEALNLLDAEGRINRRALAQWVFGNEERLKALEQRVHPAVSALREQKLTELRRSTQPPPLVVLEAVKLVESGQAQGCDVIWWITAAREVQMQRLMQERGLSEQEAELRLLHQPDAAEKRALLDELAVAYRFIDNSTTLEVLEQNLARHLIDWQKTNPLFTLTTR